jgi:hypothetical protein
MNRPLPLHDCPVLAFQVENVREAREHLASRGVVFETLTGRHFELNCSLASPTLGKAQNIGKEAGRGF